MLLHRQRHPRGRRQVDRRDRRRLPGKWGRMAPLPEKSEEFTFGDVNGKIYLFGGLPVNGTKPPLGLVQEYDPGHEHLDQEEKHAAGHASCRDRRV